MSILLSEINEQPAALERALTGGKDAIGELVAAIKARDVRYVILAARGTSDNAATYANVRRSTDLTYEATPDSIKETITLRDRTAPAVQSYQTYTRYQAQIYWAWG